MWETIPSGPVAQFSPREKRGYGSRAARAAATSVPTSIVPVFSIVSDTITGTSRFIASRVSKQATTAVLTCSRSWHVSMISRSTPASTRARACSAKASASGSTPMCPSEGSFVVGPMEPATNASAPARRIASRRVLHRRAVDLRDAVAEPVLRQHDPVGAEGVRLQHHRPRVEERLVPFPDHLGARKRSGIRCTPRAPARRTAGISIRCRFVPQAPSNSSSSRSLGDIGL